MTIDTFSNVKCTHCQSTDKTLLTDNFYRCNQCSSNYYINNSQQFESNHYVVNHNRISIKLKFILLAVIIIALILLNKYIVNQPGLVDAISDDISYTKESDVAKDTFTSLIETAYPRTAYIFYQDKQTYNNYLFKATFLTENTDESDANAVSVKNEHGNLVAYDSFSGNSIPNFSRLIDSPLSQNAAVLYADSDSIIIKNMVGNKYQLEMFDPYTGNIIWTISEKELPGIDSLTKKYSKNEKMGIELHRDNFRINLSTKYYVIDKSGRIIDYGK